MARAVNPIREMISDIARPGEVRFKSHAKLVEKEMPRFYEGIESRGRIVTKFVIEKRQFLATNASGFEAKAVKPDRDGDR